MEKETEDTTISPATARNWNRLKTEPNGRLKKRANKCKSQKRMIPAEYFSNSMNLSVIQELLEIVDEQKWTTESVIYSLGCNLLEKAGLLEKNHVRMVLKEYQHIQKIEKLLHISLPADESDLLGLVYQSLLPEGDKNRMGSYYTPDGIAANMTKGFDFSNGQCFLDPCCGSGAYLLSLHAQNPKQLFGMDRDPNAVFIARVNMLLKYAQDEFVPQIVCADYLQEQQDNDKGNFFNKEYDYIATNPPWGAASGERHLPVEIVSKETFSCFFVKAFHQLKQDGTIRFLFPEAVLNVKAHRDIRSFILTHGSIESITAYHDTFTGVFTNYIDIEVKKQKEKHTFEFCAAQTVRQVKMETFAQSSNLVFHLWEPEDEDIVQIVQAKGRHTLKDSVWALGIVTGDNANKLHSQMRPGLEAIYTGKEICPYVLKPAKKYLLYDRSQLQQAAREEIYRAPEKLAYKFISNKLVFAYDDTKSLFLNSANILIPKIPHMSVKTVMAFLNSELYQYLYRKMFGEVKILKGNLLELQFPQISESEDKKLSGLVNQFMIYRQEEIERQLQLEIYRMFEMSEQQITHIRSVIYKTS